MASAYRPPWATQDSAELIAHAGRIPKHALKSASIALFVLALVAAAARTAIRLTQQRRLHVDDGFLLAAVVLLVASMALLWQQLDEMFVAEALVTNTATTAVLTGSNNWMAQLFHFLKISDAFLVLSWTAVMAVKFSFLFFFRALIDRVRGLQLYWWIVFGVSVAVWMFGCGAVFAPCPYFDARSFSCSQGEHYGVAVAYSAAIIALDILVDLLILVMPVYLISRIQVKLRQKLALGASLCLSIIIVLTSIVCIAGIHAPTTGSNAIDVTWELFWQAAEASISVIVVSLIAFRSLFVAHASRHHPSPPQPRTPDTEQRRRQLMLRRKKLRDVSEETTWNDSSTAGTEGTPRSADAVPAVARPAPAASRFRLPGWRGLPAIPSARLSGVLTRFGTRDRGLPVSQSNIMRSHASWDESAERDLEKGLTVAESEDVDLSSDAKGAADDAAPPGIATGSLSGGTMSSRAVTFQQEPSPAELEAVQCSQAMDEPPQRTSKAGSELELPIQMPLA